MHYVRIFMLELRHTSDIFNTTSLRSRPPQRPGTFCLPPLSFSPAARPRSAIHRCPRGAPPCPAADSVCNRSGRYVEKTAPRCRKRLVPARLPPCAAPLVRFRSPEIEARESNFTTCFLFGPGTIFSPRFRERTSPYAVSHWRVSSWAILFITRVPTESH